MFFNEAGRSYRSETGSLRQRYDAVIVGGGPAGLAASIALEGKGVHCLVVDALKPLIDKGCGEGLMPDALAALDGLGVTLKANDGHEFRGIQFIDRASHVEGDFPHQHGRGIRRTQLHRILIDHALAAGAQLRWGTKVRLLPDGLVEVDGQAVQCGLVIGADGAASQVRAWAGLGAVHEETLRLGMRRHYRVRPWSEHVEIHWASVGQIYVTPVAPDEVGLVFMTRRRGQVQTMLTTGLVEHFPEIAGRLAGAEPVTSLRGAGSMTRRLKRVHAPRVALIGDASGSVDAVTGAGLAMAFRHALALAEAVNEGDLAGYGAAHREIGVLPFRMARMILLMDRWPAVERLGLRAFAARQPLFEDLLAVHVGAITFRHFATRSGPAFARQLLLSMSC